MQRKRSETVNKGPGPKRRDRAGELAGNARERGQDPSPDDRERGERSMADPVGSRVR